MDWSTIDSSSGWHNKRSHVSFGETVDAPSCASSNPDRTEGSTESGALSWFLKLEHALTRMSF